MVNGSNILGDGWQAVELFKNNGNWLRKLWIDPG